MIARGGYGFADRAEAVLGSLATVDTFALVQQTLRGPIPRASCRRRGLSPGRNAPGAGLTMPVLMIQGEEDRVTPAAVNADLLAKAVPHARLVMLDGCGHLPEVEEP